MKAKEINELMKTLKKMESLKKMLQDMETLVKTFSYDFNEIRQRLIQDLKFSELSNKKKNK